MAGGPAGEAEVVAVDELAPDRRLFPVAALGDAVGDAGPALLRPVIAPERGPDLRCDSVQAPARRCGPDAASDLLAALSDRKGAVEDYALVGLAGAGDGRAWDAAFARPRQVLGRAGATSGEQPRHNSQAGSMRRATG